MRDDCMEMESARHGVSASLQLTAREEQKIGHRVMRRVVVRHFMNEIN